MKICFASHNTNKVKELAAIVPEQVSLAGLGDLGITTEIAETGDTLEENSRIKAKFVYDNHTMPVIADDSGLLVAALNGEPGVYSARYAGPQKDGNDNMNLLLERLSNVSDRSAEFQTVITFIDDSGAEFQFKGSVKGEIIREKRGSNGFGYDPIFMPAGYNETFAELSSEVKNSISHRSIAVRKFLDHLHKTHV
ncbi:RdgB/HAM1 family non-canonical purine NTP pyrophosphatase [Ekhidna sp.]|uniref:RdgB/HAM1 family non-canonical purine NTP pyrophosphatase n=1 Tax=Ekhidna sp. TaxID=2608089 RepID=UPI003299F587